MIASDLTGVIPSSHTEPGDSINAAGASKQGTATTGTVRIGGGRGLPTGDAMAPARSCENDLPSVLAAGTAPELPPFPAAVATDPRSAGGGLSEDGDGGAPPSSPPLGLSSSLAAEPSPSSVIESSRRLRGFHREKTARKAVSRIGGKRRKEPSGGRKVERKILRLLTEIDQEKLTASRRGFGSRPFFTAVFLTDAVVVDGSGPPLALRD
ncbi:hypothetical protein GW17_00024747 [Ensete ventricosum]|nr:hypothetical protein GW17_00024747 [Ensete ventricosum]